MATAVENGVSGFVDTDIRRLVERMRLLLADRGMAARLGAGAQAYAQRRFNIDRFVADWSQAFSLVEE
jgi:hypothetical protein